MSAEFAVQLEVAGPLAMFARPDTGGTPTSYPVPTWSAAKGVLESIAFLSGGEAWINPVRVEVCRLLGEPGGSVRYQAYTTNYGGPLRKSSLFAKGTAPGGSSMQVFATVLRDVCYRLHGEIRGARGSGRGGTNAHHYLYDLFHRRLKQGRCYRTPCLGWSEFTCSYWGPFRNSVTEVDDALSLEVASMLLAVWDRPSGGRRYSPVYRQSVCINSGVLKYNVPVEWLERADTTDVNDA